MTLKKRRAVALTKLSEMGERDIINSVIDKYLKEDYRNDCAAIPMGRDYILISSDIASYGTNIPPETPPELIGRFVSAINLSDIAAMSGHPVGMITSISCSPDTDDSFLDSVMSGIDRTLREYNSEILGGDTKEGHDFLVSGTILGRKEKSKTLFRKDMKKDQVLCITGKLGRPAAGSIFYYHGYMVTKGIEMLLGITPRINEALILQELGAKAMTDLSDGLFGSLYQIKQQTGFGARIVKNDIPVDPSVNKAREISGIDETDIAMNYGGDYELLFTIENSDYGDFKAAVESEKIPVSFIGELWTGENIIFDGTSWIPIKGKGYEHFRKIRV
ncbi:MAG: thiamine-phosphate kinase [Candidatus Thermoplasmatota archaeon]|nr:thiamine-phosphate kinase [Candidatus Thermoplasmatota archaeon]MCL5665647.1 thiamine-phosphate kinase [Candidatus Thermoplasmatota archaeon]